MNPFLPPPPPPPQEPSVRGPPRVNAPLCAPCSVTLGQAKSGGVVLIAYAGPVCITAARQRDVPSDRQSFIPCQ